MIDRTTEISTILANMHSCGNDAERSLAENSLMDIVYQELRRLASRHMRSERSGHTLQATAVVHEAYLRLAGSGLRNVTQKGHFFALAARQMRSVLIDYARNRDAIKRGGGGVQVELSENYKSGSPLQIDVLMVHEALDELQKDHPRIAQVVEYKFFGGYTYEEISALLEVALITVRRDWQFARAWLKVWLTSKEQARQISLNSK